MSTSNPPVGGDEDKGPTLIAAPWALCSVTIVLVTLRFYTRFRIIRRVWWDDWCILFTLVLNVVYSAFLSAYAKIGGGRHYYYILQDSDSTRISRIVELNWVAQVFCVAAIVSGKVSVALLIYRIQAPNKWRTRFLIFCSTSSIVLVCILIIFFFTQCSPPKALWIPSAGHCNNTKEPIYFGLVAAPYWAIMDAALALTPVTIIWNLKLSKKRKVGLSLILGLGLFAAICAAVKSSYIHTASATSDLTWLTVPLLLWNGYEVNTIIIAACLPTLRPLFICFLELIKRIRDSRKSNISQSINSVYPTRSIGFSRRGAGNVLFAKGQSGDGSSASNLPFSGITRTIELDVINAESVDAMGADDWSAKQPISAICAAHVV